MAKVQCRPAGGSDSEEDDELEFFVGGGGVAAEEDDWDAEFTPAPVAGKNGGAGMSPLKQEVPFGGAGRGRGRGAGNYNNSAPARPFLGRGRGGYHNAFMPIPAEEEDPPRNWSGGRGRGASGNSRRRRRSGSSSPTPGGVDRRKLKEALCKRVPEFGTGLKQEQWGKEISKGLKSAWDADQKTPAAVTKKFPEELAKAFQACHEEKGWNVPNLALFLVVNSTDFLAPQGSKNQAQAVCTGLNDFLSSKRTTTPATASPLLSFSVDLQQAAFEAAVFQRKESLLKQILESFAPPPLCPPIKSYLLQEISKLLKKKEYTLACFCATHLHLHSSFDIHSFLVPLILQDKPAVVEDFLQDSPDHQWQLIKFLDELFQQGNNSVFGQLVYYKTHHQIPVAKDDKLNHKPISKLIKRLRNKYNLGFDCCPNIGHRQRFGELRHLFSRRYDKNEMNAESFAELIDQLSQDGGLTEDIINHYLEYQDYENTAKFIISRKLFASHACQNATVLSYLPEPWKSEWEAKLQRGVSMEVDDCWEDDGDLGGSQTNGTGNSVPVPTVQQGGLEEENWEVEEPAFIQENKKPKIKQLYRHPFPGSSVFILSEPHQVVSLCTALTQSTAGNKGILKVSGFDSEWKPIMSRSCGAALLQLAFEDGIHLLDLVSLKENLKKGAFEGPCVWKTLRRDYFENDGILKLGFDLRNDVKMLTETVPQWQGMNASWKRMLDLSSLRSLILKECPHLFSAKDGTAPNTEGESGLSELVFLCTGRSLSKEEQMSDWEKRPLRETQVQYAASDAFCLISIYRTFEQLCAEKQVNLDRITQNYFKGLANGNGGNGEPTKKKRGSAEIVMELVRVPGMIWGDPTAQGKETTASVKLVVDTMLLGLGRYLRSLGFDTVMLENNQGHEYCVNYVRREGRRIITRGLQAYGRIASQLDRVGEEDQMMYLVKSESTAAQLEEICNHFKVALTPSRLFTICFRCNTSVFIKVSHPVIFHLMELAGCHLIKKPETTPAKEIAESLNLFKNRSFDDMILYFPPEEESSKEWTLLEESVLKVAENGKTVVTKRGERVELTRMQMVSHLVDQIYICNGCGKCYWSSLKLEALYREQQLQKPK